MDASKMKNMIVIKNLPSNIVDEAFIVLKSNRKIKALERIEKEKNKNSDSKTNSKDYIIKEAEMLVSNYLAGIEKNKEIKSHNMRQMEKKCKRLKRTNNLLYILLFVSLLMYIAR